MDALKNTLQQFRQLYEKMAVSQRLTLAAVTAMVVAALSMVVMNGRSSGFVPVLYGKTFTTEELINAEQIFKENQLNDFRREGQQLLVPTGNVKQYEAAMLAAGSLTDGWAEELERKHESAGPFTSEKQLQAMKEMALAKALRKIIRALPDIEDGTVIWARSKPGRWPARGSKVTATVSVRPRAGRTLTTPLVQSLRSAVAGMVPDLPAENVTVFDQRTGVSHTAEHDNSIDSQLLNRKKQFEQHYQREIQSALSYIPEVLVTVHVDLDDLKSSVEREQVLDKSRSVALSTEEQRVSDTFRQQASAAEPGVASNAPRNLTQQRAPDKSRTIDRSDTSSVTIPSFKVLEKEFLAAMPKAVQLSISIPESYYDAVAARKAGTDPAAADAPAPKADDQLRTEINQQAMAVASKLIPAGSIAEEAINVGSYVNVDQEIVEPEIPLSITMTEIVSEWGGAVALGLLAIWAVRMVSKSAGAPAPAEDQSPLELPPLQTAAESTPESEKERSPQDVSERDELQSIVKDNPEMAAAVLSRWLRAAG